MIVKNESSNITSALKSLRPHIDGWVVCDTGSTDDTPHLIKEFFQTEEVSGYFEHHSWIDYATNRNMCIRRGKRRMPSCANWLLLDADQELVNESNRSIIDFLDHNADGYTILDKVHGVEFSNIRIINAKTDWSYKGAIHEVLEPPVEKVRRLVIRSLPRSIYTKHHAKLTRNLESDLEILIKSYRQNPRDTRTVFYLAKAFQGIGDAINATKYFSLRARMRDNHVEEIFFSQFAIAQLLEPCLSHPGCDASFIKQVQDEAIIENDKSEIDSKDVEVALQKAADILPYRYETWCALAKLKLYYDNDSDQCIYFAQKAIHAGPNKLTTLFADEQAVPCGHFMHCICGAFSLKDTSKESCHIIKSQIEQQSSLKDWEASMYDEAVLAISKYD